MLALLTFITSCSEAPIQHASIIIEGTPSPETLTGRQEGEEDVYTMSYAKSPSGVDVRIYALGESKRRLAFGGNARGDKFIGEFSNLTGSEFKDVLEGTTKDNVIRGLGDDDYVIASNGADKYFGGEGFDSVDYGNHRGPEGLNFTLLDKNTISVSGYNDGQTDPNGEHKIKNFEHFVGSGLNDYIRLGDNNNTLEGLMGNDHLWGGKGDDTYYVELNSGHDYIHENADEGMDTLYIGRDNHLYSPEYKITWDDIQVYVKETELIVKVNDKSIVSAEVHKVEGSRHDFGLDRIRYGFSEPILFKDIDFASESSIGTHGDDKLLSQNSRSNFYQGRSGNDQLGEAKSTLSEMGNTYLGGRGNDILYGSNGDDIYIFDRGSGVDKIYEVGGSDKIVFGPTIRESFNKNEVLFEKVGEDYIIGISTNRYSNEPRPLKASEAADRIHIIGAALSKDKRIEMYTVEEKSYNLIEKFTY